MKKFYFTPSQTKIVQGIQKQTMGQVWVVGGAIRDLLLGRDPKDIDFATDLEPKGVQALLGMLGFISIPDQTAWDHGIVRTVDKHSGHIIDIATLRKDDHCDGRHAKVSFTKNVYDDLSRRDLTINAIAACIDVDGTVNQLLDPFRGEEDIDDKVVRLVGNAYRRIKEDKLRMIRACRFMALGDDWDMGRQTRKAIMSYMGDLDEVSKERIRDELLKGLAYPNPAAMVRALDDCELLKCVIRPLHDCVGIEQNEHHAETVFEHCIASLGAAASLTDNTLLRLAALLHDVGKAITVSTGSDGRTHFYRHEVEGAAVVYEYLTTYRFAKKEIEYITKLIRHHQWRFEDNSKDKTIRKWLQTVGKDWKDLIMLRCADRRGNLAKQDKPMMTRYMKDLVRKAEEILSRHDALFREDLAINGDDLKELGVPPGPVYKEIFSNMLGIVIVDPERNTREWLTNYVKKNYVEEKA